MSSAASGDESGESSEDAAILEKGEK